MRRTTNRLPSVKTLAIALAALACSPNERPTNRGAGGAGGTAGPGASDAGPDGAASDAGRQGAFAPVQAVFDQFCVWCHDPAHPFAGDNPTFVEMPLVSPQSYDALVGVPAHESCGGTRVVPGDPEHSYLYRKITDETPCDGARMPRAGAILAMPLPAAQVATIHDWIANGAGR